LDYPVDRDQNIDTDCADLGQRQSGIQLGVSSPSIPQ
jgi:hypothetical protein